MPTETPDFIELKTTAKTVSTNAEQILRENDRRRYLLIQNNGAKTAYIAFGNTLGPAVSSTSGIKIAAGGEYELDRNKRNMCEQTVYATAADTNTAILITEGAYSGEFTPFSPPPAGASSSSSSSSSSSPSSASSDSSSSDSSDSSSSDSSSSDSSSST